MALSAIILVAAALLGACAHPASQASAGNGNGDGLDGIAPAAGGADSAASTAPTPDTSPAGPPGSGIASGEPPYVVIRFPDSSVDYQSSLAEAVRRAKERKPNLAFDLVALTPPAQSADDLADAAKEAQDRAQGVVSSLGGMGIPADRVNVVTWTGQATGTDEIRLYIR